MKYIYVTLRNMCLFFFIAALFSQILIVGKSTQFSDLLLTGLLFGVLMAVCPNILQFMKIKQNAGAMILMGIVITFIFFFIGYYVFELFDIVPGNIVLNADTKILEVQDQTFGLILISMVSSISSVLLQILQNQK